MSMTTAPTSSRPVTGLRPVPWRRMAWVVWRQHRLVFATTLGLLAVIALYLLVSGIPIRAAYEPVAACQPAASASCSTVANDFLSNYAPLTAVTQGIFQFITPLLGAFTGASLLAREFETGTFRYTWTQGFGRARWATAKIVPLAFTLLAAAGVVSGLFSWYYAPIANAGKSILSPTVFDLTGVSLAGWTLLAFSLGSLVGFLIRRVIPAIVTTAVAWAGLAVLVGTTVRNHYLSPIVSTSVNQLHNAFMLSQTWMHGTRPASLQDLNRELAHIDIRADSLQVFSPGPTTPPNMDPVRYLVDHGFSLVTIYQPDDRYWTFQLIEGGWLVILSVLLLATTVWLVRRRVS